MIQSAIVLGNYQLEINRILTIAMLLYLLVIIFQ